MTDFLPADLKPLRYLTEVELAALINRAVQTLRNERNQGRGFPYVKVGRSVRYSLQEILRAMESHRIDPGGRGVAHD